MWDLLVGRRDECLTSPERRVALGITRSRGAARFRPPRRLGTSSVGFRNSSKRHFARSLRAASLTSPPPHNGSCSTTRRRTASTSTCAGATLSPRARALVHIRSVSENLFTTLPTACWCWLLKGDALGNDTRRCAVSPRSRRRRGISSAVLVADARVTPARSLVAVAPGDDNDVSPCSNQFQLTANSAFPPRSE